MNSKKIGIIGLGRIGVPVASAYMKAGYRVFGLDIDHQSMDRLKSEGGIAVDTPADMARATQVILLLVLNDAQVQEVVYGENGILQASIEDLTVVCMSTINRETLEEVVLRCQESGVKLVDCPFTGGPARVPLGTLTLIIAGQPSVIKGLSEVLEVIGNPIRVGDNPGLGQAVKHCNQLLVGITHAATMELITLANKMGLEADLVCKVVGEGIAGSDYFRLLSEAVLQGTPSPGGLGQMCKDVSIVRNSTGKAGFKASVLLAAADYFKQAEALGMQHLEGADLIEVVKTSNL